jgi:ribosomal protein S18 acetylase RimI-like enzyme
MFRNLHLLRSVSNDIHNNVINGEVRISLLEQDTSIGLIQYRPHNGQIGLLFIDKKYRGKGLGTSLLLIAMNEIIVHNVDNIWCVTRKDHPYWSRLMDFKYKYPVHNSVTGAGYSMKL